MSISHQPNHRSARFTATLLLGVVCASVGCSMPGGGQSPSSLGALRAVSIPNPLDWGSEDCEPRSGSPERIVATWVDTVLQRPGEPAQRGFGGRLYFYDRGEDPIEVKGRLVVYAFDENERELTDQQPTRRFIFPAEQLKLHASESEIGQSYSFWLPWDEFGGESTQISLIARFEPLDGSGLIVSQPATHLLPGRKAPNRPETLYADSKTEGNQRVRTASFQEREIEPSKESKKAIAAKPRERLSTTTIRLGK